MKLLVVAETFKRPPFQAFSRAVHCGRMKPRKGPGDGASLEWLTADVYDELRERARAMSRGAPPTLAGTAGLHTALERILRRRRTFRDRRHFIAYCLFLIRRLWIS